MKTDKEITRDTYNNRAADLADYFDGIGMRENDIKRAFSLVGKNNPKVLEIGCGNGRDAKGILKYTDDYLGIDISEEMIKLAKRRHSKAEFKVADMANFAYLNNLDAVFSFASFLHLSREEVSLVVQKICQSLNKGGVLYISLKYGNYRRYLKEDKFGRRVFYFYTPSDIQELAGDNFCTRHIDYQVIGKTKWFTMSLQRK